MPGGLRLCGNHLKGKGLASGIRVSAFETAEQLDRDRLLGGVRAWDLVLQVEGAFLGQISRAPDRQARARGVEELEGVDAVVQPDTEQGCVGSACCWLGRSLTFINIG